MHQKDFLRKRSYASQLPILRWRIYMFVLLVAVVALIICFRLYSLQVIAYPAYHSIAEDQHTFFETIIPKRGEIYLKDEKELYPLAVNEERQMAYAVPREITDAPAVARTVSQALGIDEGEIAGKISDPNSQFQIIKHKLNEEEVSKIKELNLTGIYLSPEQFRYYPGGELAAQVVGFVGSDGKDYKGRYGLEFYFNDELQGKLGNMMQERDTRGRWISITDQEIQPAEDGKTLVLTIDHTVQYEVEKVIREAVEQFGADSGTAIVIAPQTGKILAMANYPYFNPNEYSKVEDMSMFQNNAVSMPYECGSVFKAITAAIGIDSGKINPDTTYVDTGRVNEAGYEIKNSDEKSYGRQTMTQVLEKSLNTGAIYIERLIGNRSFSDYVRRFGFGEKTGIALPGEAGGNIKNLDILRININFFTAAFGQGISVTPLQLANAYAAIANGGKLMKPQIVDKIIYSDGREEEVKPEEIRQVISKESAQLVGKMLRSVVVNGHGKRADVPGYLVGGKTGTAQVAKSEAKGYEEGMTIGSFAGFAPVDDPQFTVLVKIQNPKGVQWAESSAAPTFGKIMKFLLEYYKVEPTEEIDVKKLTNL